MTHTNDERRQLRRQVEARLREVIQQLGRVNNSDEEARLLNEELYLSGALAALDAIDGKGTQLLKVLGYGYREDTTTDQEDEGPIPDG